MPWAWRQYAHRGYLLLQQLDRRLLEPRLPAAVFYNLMIAARKDSTRQRRQDVGPPGGARSTRRSRAR